MKILIETNSKKQFSEKYKELINNSKYINDIELSLAEDNVTFGSDNELIIGIYFIAESIKSGITYDLLKELFLQFTSKIYKEKNKTTVKYYLKDSKGKIQKIEIINIEKGQIKIGNTEIKIQ